MEQYILESQEALKQLIRDLCAIPAPSHHEEQRAEFCRDWFLKNGGTDVTVDEAKNVICAYNVTENNPVVAIMAHTDTVFPDREPMPFREEGGKMYCPGVTDDTASLAVLMMCAKYIMERKLPTQMGILFIANSCEEGLGDLKGCRAIVEAYGHRMAELVTLDDTSLQDIVCKAVGSHRYRIRALTEGGHSFRDFGRRNAIQVLATLVDALYRVEVPVVGDSHTTYNVGEISGGTSVNTIAQQAEMLYEYRSDNRECLQKMEETLQKILKECTPADATLEVEKIGDRPCAGAVDKAKWEDLKHRAGEAVRKVTEKEPTFTAGSTDCNIPLSKGIPALCLGVCVGGGCHTREEWLDTESLSDGCRLFMEFFRHYLA